MRDKRGGGGGGEGERAGWCCDEVQCRGAWPMRTSRGPLAAMAAHDETCQTNYSTLLNTTRSPYAPRPRIAHTQAAPSPQLTMSVALPYRDINVHSSPSHYAFSSPSSPSSPTLVVDRPSGDIRLHDGKLLGSKRVSSIAGILGMIKLRLGIPP
jgi:hypothetical protein